MVEKIVYMVIVVLAFVIGLESGIETTESDHAKECMAYGFTHMDGIRLECRAVEGKQ